MTQILEADETSQVKHAETWEASNDDYHQSPGISNSKLSDFIDDPALYYHYHVAQDWKRPEPTKDMLFGTAIHEMLPPGECNLEVINLEDLGEFDEVVREKIIVVPSEVLNSKGHCVGPAYNAWKKENAGKVILKQSEVDAYVEKAGMEAYKAAHGGKQLVTESEAEPYLGIIQRAKDNPAAMRLLTVPPEYVEMNCRWKDPRTGLLLRCRFDRILPGEFIGDIKTTRAKSKAEWQAELYRCGYHRAAAHYQRGGYSLTGDLLSFRHLPCRKSRPYTVEVVELDDDFIALGNQELDAALDRVQACLDSGRWELQDHGTIQVISPPSWVVGQIKRADFYENAPSKFAESFNQWIGNLEPSIGE